MKFREGYNERLATPVATTTADANGLYSTTLPIGVYTLEVAKDGYSTEFVNVAVYGSTMTKNVAILENTECGSNGIRAYAAITLSWDANPRDLDSHLTGPIDSTNSTRFHVYYANKTASTATLDRDDVDGYGPETVTLSSAIAGGTYKYYVHQYAGTGTIQSGNAKVTIIMSTGTSRTFTAPSSSSYLGVNDIWHVFDIDSYGNIYPVNEIIGNDSSSSTLFALAGSSNNDERSLFIHLPAK